MAELRVKGTGTLKLFENDNTSSVTIASPASLGGDRTVTLPDGDVTLGDNTPAFQAKLSANQDPSASTWTTVTFNTEVFDTDGCYDNTTNYRFTPTTAGKYLAYWAVTADISVVPSLDGIHTRLRKNGTAECVNYMDNNDDNWVNMTNGASLVVDMNGSSDYLDVQGYIAVSSGASYFHAYGNTYFGAYLLIGA